LLTKIDRSTVDRNALSIILFYEPTAVVGSFLMFWQICREEFCAICLDNSIDLNIQVLAVTIDFVPIAARSIAASANIE
jgi:hypothetical protein